MKSVGIARGSLQNQGDAESTLTSVFNLACRSLWQSVGVINMVVMSLRPNHESRGARNRSPMSAMPPAFRAAHRLQWVGQRRSCTRSHRRKAAPKLSDRIADVCGRQYPTHQ